MAFLLFTALFAFAARTTFLLSGGSGQIRLRKISSHLLATLYVAWLAVMLTAPAGAASPFTVTIAAQKPVPTPVVVTQTSSAQLTASVANTDSTQQECQVSGSVSWGWSVNAVQSGPSADGPWSPAASSTYSVGFVPGFSPTSSDNPTTLNASFTQASYYKVTVAATASFSSTNCGAQTVPATKDVVFEACDFSLSADPNTLSVSPGGSVATNISVYAIYDFPGSVGLSASGLPAGVTAAFSPTSVTPGSSNIGTSALTFAAGAGVVPGTYTITVTGTSSGISRTTTVTLQIANFSVTGSPSELDIPVTQSGTDTVTVSSINGFSGAISLAISGMPAGVTATFNPTSVTLPSGGSQTSTLSVSVSGTALTGYYPLTITATGPGGITSSSTITLAVTDFILQADPVTLNIAQGSQDKAHIYFEDAGPYNRTVAMTVTGAPAGVTATLSPTSLSSGTTGLSDLNVSVGGGVPTGSYPLTVTGTDPLGHPTHSVTVTLNVASFTLSAAPSYLNIPVGQTKTAQVSVVAVSGFSGTVALTISGQPSGMTATFNPTSVTGSGSSTLTVAVGPSVPTGLYSLTVTGTSGSGNAQTLTFPVDVTDFTLAASPAALSVAPGQGAAGGNNAATITAVPVESYSGTINLTATAKNSAGDAAPGLTASFSPASIMVDGSGASTASTMTAVAAAGLSPGTYTVTVTGTDSLGVPVHTAVVTVTVANFSLSASSSHLNMPLGQSRTAAISMSAYAGFSGNLALSVTGAPAGLSSAFSPASVSPGAPSTLTVSASATAAIGTYTITVTGTSATGLMASTLVTVDVTFFSLSTSPVTLSLTPGASGTSAVTVSPVGNYTGTVSLSASAADANGNAAPGLTAAFSPSMVGSGSTSTMTVSTANNLSPGSYAVIISGTDIGGGPTYQTAITVDVASFKLSLSTTPLRVAPGNSATTSVSITPVGTYNGIVSLSVSGLPDGVTATTNPTSCSVSGSGTISTLTILAGNNATSGTYAITVTGTDANGYSATTTLSLVIADFALAADPSSLVIASGQIGQSTIILQIYSGFGDTVGLSTTNLPTGVTSSFSPASLSSTSATASSLTLTAGSTAKAGTYTVNVVGTDNSASLSHSVPLVVTILQKVWDEGSPIGQDRSADGSPVYNGRLITPQDQRLSPAVPSTVTVTAGTTISCSVEPATDVDHWTLGTQTGYAYDRVTYAWSCSVGSFQGSTNGPSATWVAPASPASNVTLACTLNDLPTPVVLPDTGIRDDVAVVRTVTMQVLAKPNSSADFTFYQNVMNGGTNTVGNEIGLGGGSATAGDGVWAALQLKVGAGEQVDPSINNVTMRIQEDDSHHTFAQNHFDTILDLTQSTGWEVYNGSAWVGATVPPKTANVGSTPLLYRMRLMWDTRTQPLGHNGGHTISLTAVNGDGTLTSVRFQHSGSAAYGCGPNNRAMDVENVVIANVSTSAGNSDYFKFDPDSSDPALNAPNLQFNITDTGDPHQYKWTVKARPTDSQNWTVTVSGQETNPGHVTVNFANPASGQTETGNIDHWGSYTFDVQVQKFDNLSNPAPQLLDSWSLKSPVGLSIPVNVPGTTSQGHALYWNSSSQTTLSAGVSYYLNDTANLNASSVEVDLLDPDLNLQYSQSNLATEVNSAHTYNNFYTLPGGGTPGQYVAVFTAQDSHGLSYRDHQNKRMLAINDRVWDQPIEWLPGTGDWEGVWVKAWRLKGNLAKGGVKTEELHRMATTNNSDVDLPSVYNHIWDLIKSNPKRYTTRAAVNATFFDHHNGSGGYPLANAAIGTGGTWDEQDGSLRRWAFGISGLTFSKAQMQKSGSLYTVPSSILGCPYGAVAGCIVDNYQGVKSASVACPFSDMTEMTKAYARTMVGWTEDQNNFFMIHANQGYINVGGHWAPYPYGGWTWSQARDYFTSSIHEDVDKSFTSYMRAYVQGNYPNYSGFFEPELQDVMFLDGGTHSDIAYIRILSQPHQLQGQSISDAIKAVSEYHDEQCAHRGNKTHVQAYALH